MCLLDFSEPVAKYFCGILYVGDIAKFPCLSSFTADIVVFVTGMFSVEGNRISLLVTVIGSVVEILLNVLGM